MAISLQCGQFDPIFQTEAVAPTNHSASQKTRLNDLLYGIKMWTDLSSVLSQCTRLTDGQTEFSSLDRVCISCSAAKTLRNKQTHDENPPTRLKEGTGKRCQASGPWRLAGVYNYRRQLDWTYFSGSLESWQLNSHTVHYVRDNNTSTRRRRLYLSSITFALVSIPPRTLYIFASIVQSIFIASQK